MAEHFTKLMIEHLAPGEHGSTRALFSGADMEVNPPGLTLLRAMFSTVCLVLIGVASVGAQDFDLVIANGRVMDPESGLDAVRNVGVSQGTIRAISTEPLRGKTVIDAKGLVIAPGFIDLHQHGQTPEDYRFKAADGVTSALELEVGTADVDRWYAAREGKSLIHFGVSIGHIPTRMTVMGDTPAFLPGGKDKAAVKAASDEDLAELKRKIELGLKQGAVAVGFGVQYTPAASQWELLEMFRVAAKYQASCHVHVRARGDREGSIGGFAEVLAASALTGAPLHVVHAQSSGGRSTPKLLQMISEAQTRGLDVTTECYPYRAGMTDISSAIYDDGWQERLNTTYSDLLWPPTGERLTPETFAKYRKTGGLVVAFTNPEEVVRAAVASPLTMIASDGLPGHPRNAGTYARILGSYVREQKALTLMDALRKMSLMPAQRLEKRAPMMKNKGRVRVGADADLVVFDPAKILDQATFEKPAVTSTGIQHVLVNGVFVVKNGVLQDGVAPGHALRAPVFQ
jgi:N-acyl-D-aspartate/D-glutamate deacylase